jgi:hypothetical protein
MEAGVADTQDRDTLQVNNPVCPVCVHPMSILRIEPGEPDHQMRTYSASIAGLSKSKW